MAFLLWIGCKEKVEETKLYAEDEKYVAWVGRDIAEVDFHFRDLKGAEVDLAKYRGKVLMLDFWATWGPPCMELLPSKLAAHKKYQHLGFDIVGISADFDRSNLEAVVKQRNIPWPQYYNSAGTTNAAITKFGIKHFPTTWLVDKKGVVRYISAGRDMETKIETLLAEGAGEGSGKEASWTDKLFSKLGGGKKEDDPISAMQMLAEDPAQYMDLKNITITATRRIATLKTGASTHQLVIGKQFTVATEAGEVTVQCKEINRDGLVLTVPGQDNPISLAL